MSNFTSEIHAPAPPILPPKPSSQDASRIGTPTVAASPPPPPHPYPPYSHTDAVAGQQVRNPGGGGIIGGGVGAGAAASHAVVGAGPMPSSSASMMGQAAPMPDPGDQWLPKVLQDKSKQDLAEILASPALLEAITHSPDSIDPSLRLSHQALQAALTENLDLASQLSDLESRLSHQRSATQAQLLSTHALERQWRQKQSDMDRALARFSPAALYQLLAQSVHEQATLCQAMEESFLDGGGGGGGGGTESAGEGGGGEGRSGAHGGSQTSEREAAEWIRRYREARVLHYLRQERKERWDEGRVGGWR